MSRLPKGWVETNATIVAEPIRGVTYKKEQAREGPAPDFTALLRANNIQQGKLDLSELVYVPNENIANNQMLKFNDIVIAMSSGSISVVGKAAQVKQELKASFGAFCGVLRPNSEIEPRYLGWFLKSNAYRTAISRLARGVNINNLKWSHFEEIPLPLAPLPEQKRIADKLDRVLARVDACCDRLDRIPALLKRLRQSILAAAISGRLTEDWRAQHTPSDMAVAINALPSSQKARRGVTEDMIPTSEYIDSWVSPIGWWSGTAASLLCKGVFIDLKDGNHGANHPVVSDFSPTGLPFITAAQVNRFAIDYESAYKLSGRPLEKLKVGFAKAGDVVLTHKGTVGRLGIVDRDCVLTPQTTYYRTNREYVAPEFLMYYMASQAFSGQLDEIKSQTTRDFVPITLQYGLVHLIPSLPEQLEIVRRVETLFAFADRFEARLLTAQSAAERLTPALLAKAFRGELVPQDSNDEPASELLRRLTERKSRIAVRDQRVQKGTT